MFHIVFNVNEAFVKYASVLITSIIKNTNVKKSFKEICEEKVENFSEDSICDFYENVKYINLKDEQRQEGYCFHIMIDDIKEQTKDLLKNLEKELCQTYPCKIKIHIINDDEFKDCENVGAASLNKITYYKMKIASKLDLSINKCLYLDVDMLVFGDLRELFAIDLKDKFMAGVLDWKSLDNSFFKDKENGQILSIILPNAYINTGFMLMNLDLWRLEKIEDQCMQLAKNYIPKFAEQCIINATLKGNVIRLSPKWNLLNYIIDDKHFPLRNEAYKINRFFYIPYDFMPYTKDEIREALNDIKIIHLHTPKPWKNKMNVNFRTNVVEILTKNAFSKIWWDMALNTPFFSDELKFLKAELDNEEENICDIIEIIKIIQEIKTSIPYQMGQILISLKKDKSFKTRLSKINSLLKFKRNYKKEDFEMLKNKISKLKDSQYFGEIKKIQNHLSYLLGTEFIDNPYKFLFKLKEILKRYKEQQSKNQNDK